MTTPYRARKVAIPAGAERAYLPAEWRGALVAVEVGEVELVSIHGLRRRFRTGALLSLDGLHLRCLANPGPDTALLAAAWRLDR
jgi:hypothetical protein